MSKKPKSLKKPTPQPDLMERTRATVALLNGFSSSRKAKEMEMYGFLSLFHPKLSDEKKRALARIED